MVTKYATGAIPTTRPDLLWSRLPQQIYGSTYLSRRWAWCLAGWFIVGGGQYFYRPRSEYVR